MRVRLSDLTSLNMLAFPLLSLAAAAVSSSCVTLAAASPFAPNVEARSSDQAVFASSSFSRPVLVTLGVMSRWSVSCFISCGSCGSWRASTFARSLTDPARHLWYCSPDAHLMETTIDKVLQDKRVRNKALVELTFIGTCVTPAPASSTPARLISDATQS